MMTPRQAAFRADFRARIAPWYFGLGACRVDLRDRRRRHLVLRPPDPRRRLVRMAGRAGGLPRLQRLRVVDPPLRHASAGPRASWASTSGTRWRTTSSSPTHEPTFDSARDFRIVFFPPYALIAFIGCRCRRRCVLGWLGPPNAGWLLLITNVALYLNYELFHFCCHVKDDRLVRHIPLINTIRRHHIAHHDTAIMMEHELQPDLSDRRLVLRHQRSRPRAAQARLQRLRHALPQDQPEEGARHRRQLAARRRQGLSRWPRPSRAGRMSSAPCRR